MFNKLTSFIVSMTVITTTSISYAQSKTDDIIITASKVEQSLSSVGSSVTVLTKETLMKRGDRTVADSLSRVSGINLSRSGGVGGQSFIRMRGTNSGQSLVLIDGIRVSDTAGIENSFDFSTLMINDIERIEVLKGNQSSLYGSDAIGGVINIITHKRQSGLGGNAFLEGGSFGTVHGGASVKAGNDKVYYGLTANHFHNDGFSRRNTGKEMDGNQISHFRGNVGADITENLNLDIQAGYELANFEYDSGFGSSQISDGNKELFYSKSQLTHLSFDDTLKNTLYYDASQTDRHDTNSFGFSDFKGTHQKIGYQGDINLFDRDVLTVGTDLTLEDAKNSYGFSGENENYAYFGNYIKGLGENITLNFGGRLDDHDRFGSQGTYRSTLAFNIPQSKTKIHSSLGTGFKAPTLYQLYDTLSGNPNLDAETSTGYDFGFTQVFPQEYVTTDITFFNTEINNLIDYDNSTLNYVNTSKADIRGIETQIDIKATDNLNFFGNYTLTDAKNALTQQKLARRPRHAFNVGTDFQIGKTQTTLLGRYVGEQIDQYSYGTHIPQYNKSFFTADIKTSYDVTDKVAVYGRLDNIFDQDFQEVLTYNTSGFVAFGGIRLKY